MLATDVQVGEPTLEDDANTPADGGEEEEDEVRFTLTSEGGLNDALASPFVYAAIRIVDAGWDRNVIAFFGIRGFGSIYCLAYALGETEFPHAAGIAVTRAMVVASAISDDALLRAGWLDQMTNSKASSPPTAR